MLYREIIAVCSEIHTKHINTQCGQNVELFKIRRCGMYINHWVLKCKITNKRINLLLLLLPFIRIFLSSLQPYLFSPISLYSFASHEIISTQPNSAISYPIHPPTHKSFFFTAVSLFTFHYASVSILLLFSIYLFFFYIRCLILRVPVVPYYVRKCRQISTSCGEECTSLCSASESA
jgi:hypothetical protein